jgi:uncharacterized protein (DUF1800 family)
MADPALILHALNRFGLGARPGDAARAAGDPRGFVAAQLASADPTALPVRLPTSAECYVQQRQADMARERERAKTPAVATPAAAPQAPAVVMGPPLPPGPALVPVRGTPGPAALPANASAMAPATSPIVAGGMPVQPSGSGPRLLPVPPPQPPEQALFRADAAARFARLTAIEGGLVDRLVLFWSNHFCVSVAKGNQIRCMAGAFEREAIRPHVLGRFADMLKAVEQHPAMLFYLDNTQSVGPTSRAGQNGRRGLNENLAREILELHTLGVDGGYTQGDVTSLARIITGWTVTSPDDDMLFGGRYTFAPSRHEPGDHAVLGRVYKEAFTPAQGEAALANLAAHPSTARHVSRKLVRHFVADVPPPALVDRLAKTYQETEGDLGQVVRALITAPEAWAQAPTKMRSPQEFVIALARAAGQAPDLGLALGAMASVGQPLWQPPGPNGFPDSAADWASPEGMAGRLDVAAQWGRLNGALDPKGLIDGLFGPAASAETRQAVARAESRQQGLAILAMAPEFHRR